MLQTVVDILAYKLRRVSEATQAYASRATQSLKIAPAAAGGISPVPFLPQGTLLTF